ncbi:MAG: SDR family NAD(P)-dependent oxidoreductase, partial [Pseudomonadota bacterium]
MDMGIAGRKALLTGASKGMGRACAFALAAEGADLTLVARTPAPLEQTANDIRSSTGATVLTVAADITTEEGRAAALKACPQPDILLNNAGGMKPGDFREHDRDQWIEALDLMMLAPIEMIRATFDGMVERGFGRIVNITSRGVKIPHAELSLSNGARTGLVGFCAGIARLGVARNVTVNSILPGIVDSDGQRQHVEKLVETTGRSFGDIWGAR